MKATLQKIYFGYIAAASMLTLVLAPLSIFFERSWYHDFVSPVYFWGELLAVGIALGEWETSCSPFYCLSPLLQARFWDCSASASGLPR
ncbi:MAG: hypothetical protein IJX47_01120 [Clostridia bacterium]|nr:hypothetical protein [Clostridia bacterium]